MHTLELLLWVQRGLWAWGLGDIRALIVGGKKKLYLE